MLEETEPLPTRVASRRAGAVEMGAVALNFSAMISEKAQPALEGGEYPCRRDWLLDDRRAGEPDSSLFPGNAKTPRKGCPSGVFVTFNAGIVTPRAAGARCR